MNDSKPKKKIVAAPAGGIDKTKSFRPPKKVPHKGIGLKQIVEMTMKIGNIQLAVELPAGEDLNEWLAVNTIEFYNEINILYGILTEFCNSESCPTMSAGPKYEYLWADGHNVKTPLKVSAAEYIDFLMTWVEN